MGQYSEDPLKLARVGANRCYSPLSAQALKLSGFSPIIAASSAFAQGICQAAKAPKCMMTREVYDNTSRLYKVYILMLSAGRGHRSARADWLHHIRVLHTHMRAVGLTRLHVRIESPRRSGRKICVTSSITSQSRPCPTPWTRGF